MKLIQIVMAGLLLAMPTQASPKKFFQSIGHEVKETGIDFVTFRHPTWNLIAFAEIAADLADAKTTADCQRLPNCLEANSFLYGKHPDFHKVALIDIGTSFTLITADHWMHTHTPRPYIKTADYWWIAPGAVDIFATSKAAYMNTKVNLNAPLPKSNLTGPTH